MLYRPRSQLAFVRMLLTMYVAKRIWWLCKWEISWEIFAKWWKITQLVSSWWEFNENWLAEINLLPGLKSFPLDYLHYQYQFSLMHCTSTRTCIPIALNFRGSKFSQMVVFEDFVKIISRIHCLNHAHTTHVMYMGVAYKQVLSDTHCHIVVRARACNCQRSNAYFGGISLGSIPCRFGSMLSIDAFTRENCSLSAKNFHWDNFANGWKFTKFAKLKTHENLALYGKYFMKWAHFQCFHAHYRHYYACCHIVPTLTPLRIDLQMRSHLLVRMCISTACIVEE